MKTDGPRIRLRTIEILGGTVSGFWAIFWFVQIIRTEVPSSPRAFAMTVYFAIIAGVFARGARGFPAFIFWPFPILCVWFVRDPGSRDTIGAVGVATVVSSFGLVVAAHVLDRWRRRIPMEVA